MMGETKAGLGAWFAGGLSAFLAHHGLAVAALHVVPLDTVTVEVVQDGKAVLAAAASGLPGLAVVGLR